MELPATQVYDQNLGIGTVPFPNGFVLYLIGIPRKKVSFARLRLKSGPVYEQPWYNGIAQMLEHILLDERQYRAFVKKFGGDFNGYTQRHVVDLVAKVKTSCTPLLIKFLYRPIGRFEKTLSRYVIGQEVLEREIVENEEARERDTPHDFLQNILLSAIFKGTELERLELGTELTYNSVTRDLLRQYKTERVVPPNIALAIGGSYSDEEELKRLAMETFGSMESKESIDSINIPVEAPKGKVVATIDKDNRRLNFGIGWRVPAYHDEDAVALIVLDNILLSNGTGIFYDRIRVMERLAYDPESQYFNLGYAGAFFLKMGVKPRRFEEALDKTTAVIKDVRANITQQQVIAARNVMLADLDEIVDNSEELTEKVLDDHFFPGSFHRPDMLERELSEIKPGRIVEVARKYLDLDNYAFAAYGPIPEDLERILGKGEVAKVA